MENFIGNPDSKNKRSSGQLKLWAMILLSASPIVIAAYMYFGDVWRPAGTTNKGSFVIPPLSSELLDIKQLHAEESTFQQIDGKQKWIIIIVADNPCDDRCERTLYLSRQVITALGREADRVSRLLLFTHLDSQLEQLLKEQNPGLVTQQTDQKTVDDLIESLSVHDLLLNSYDMLLMDPLGNIMLYYQSAQEGKDLLEDLKRLLKVSKIG